MKEKCYDHFMYLDNKALCCVSSKKPIPIGETFNYKGVKYQITFQMSPALKDFNTFKEEYIVPCIVKKFGQIKYKWVAECNDGSFNDESKITFPTLKKCYEDMRNAVLEKMKWNTEYEDFDDVQSDDYIGYDVHFNPRQIVHKSYSGEYTYNIVEVTEME